MPWSVLDAPSNLGLRPPERGVVPGVYKLAGSLRDRGIVASLGATDAGVVTPPRYHPASVVPAGVRNEDGIARYSRVLADRILAEVNDSRTPLVLGGDCSILLGAMLGLRRIGRYGLIFIDGHSDFRHPGNSSAVGSAAGEDLALVTGRGDSLADLEGLRPLVRGEDVVVIGPRPADLYLEELRGLGVEVFTAPRVRQERPAVVARKVLGYLRSRPIDGFWIHLDVDVLDPHWMPAVDAPSEGGIDFEELTQLLRGLVSFHDVVGLDVTIYDPDLDEEAILADKLVMLLRDSLA